ncbi:MAG: alanine--tRNA ligase [Candidatus Walczuchella monophlebidarum]
MFTSRKIRQSFLNFFQKKNHQIFPSSPIVIKNDPSLMFTNAGMNPFKDYFLSQRIPHYPRIANTQKCLRVVGKHNDLEDVGHDPHHHTMFEMLGNWSFGDYYKKEAIEWSWELLTEVYKIPSENLYVTIFSGDDKNDISPDEESRFLWERFIDKNRIISFGKRENFWEMGSIGPCGPCSEIHIDLRSSKEKKSVYGKDLVNKNHPDVIELWNLVFIEFLRKSDGSLEKLENRHIDTGLGIERLCRVLQNKSSNFDTDIFRSLIKKIESVSNVNYGKNSQIDIAIRVIVDHIRAISFAIADGQNPSNIGPGYVIRRLLRRSISYGYQFLHHNKAFLYKLVKVLVQEMGDIFPELVSQQKWIEEQVQAEESTFFNTITHGINRMENLIEETKQKRQQQISGDKIFELYDTYGLPIDISRLIAADNFLKIDEIGFKKEMSLQKERARKSGNIQHDDWTILNSSFVEKKFIGHEILYAHVYIQQYRRVQTIKGPYYQIVLNQTPFCPEGGGQVGDSGYLENEFDTIRIINTYKENGLFLHTIEKLPDNIQKPFKASVDKNRRKKIEKNHSATHLLHYALKKVLGDHVSQKGSDVGPDRLRFDFSHPQKIRIEQLQSIEMLVQYIIFKDYPLLERRNIPFETAISEGSVAIFGEKYVNQVRSIGFGPSLELCFGTHVKKTGEIGLFKIVSESSVGSGLRRIEAITEKTAIVYLNKIYDDYNQIIYQIHNPYDPIKTIQQLQQEIKKLRTQINVVTSREIQRLKKEWLTKAKKHDRFMLISEKTNLEPTAMKTIALELRREHRELITVVGRSEKNNVLLCIAVSDDLVDHGVNACQILQKLSPDLNGGGHKFFAMAKGNNSTGLNEAIKLVESLIFN